MSDTYFYILIFDKNIRNFINYIYDRITHQKYIINIAQPLSKYNFRFKLYNVYKQPLYCTSS